MEASLMELFSNPETFESLSMGERAVGAGVTTLMGMGITFCVLTLLWCIIALFSRALGTTEKKTAVASPAASATMASSVPTTTAMAAGSETAIPQSGNAELIAVISAAIATYEGDGVSSNFVVRRISRVNGGTTSWSNAGHMECLESRRI